MTIAEIQKNIRENAYQATYKDVPKALPSEHIQDENMSVVWNREWLMQYNNRRKSIMNHNRAAENAMSALFEDHLLSALQNDYRMTKQQANLTLRKAYQSGHAMGFAQVLTDAEELAEFWEEMVAAND